MTPGGPPALRVVSLVPSVSETLRAWGVEPVAVTRFCEQPDLPTVGGTKDPDIARIVALTPDLVVLDREENRREDAEALQRAGVRTHVLHVTDLAGVPAAMADLAVAVGRPPAPPGATPVEGAAEAEAEAEADAASGALRVWVPIWRRPWMSISVGTYAASLLAAAGMTVVADGDGRYPTTSLEGAARLRPDVVLAPSEPYPFAERHRAQLSSVAPVEFVDGRDLFWWGVRTPDALVRLRRMVRDLTSGAGSR